MSTYGEKFRQLHLSRDFISVDALHPLYECCANKDDCWRGVNPECRPEAEHIVISNPWVGAKYDELRLLIIGMNTNSWVGEGALKYLVETACEELRSNPSRREVFINSDPLQRYGGTVFYHRAGACAFEFARSAKLAQERSTRCDDGFPSNLDISEAYDFVSYTNQVKCTLKGGRGKPTTAMWNNCGAHVLRDEIRILEPKYILVLGKRYNWEYFYRKVLDGREWPAGANGRTRLDTVKFDHGEVKVILAQHPMHIGPSVFAEVQNVIHDIFGGQ